MPSSRLYLLLLLGLAVFRVSRGAVCKAVGDPHYTTFDGVRINFQGNCQYVLSEVCADARTQTNPRLFWQVSSQNKQRANTAVSLVEEVTFSFVSPFDRHFTMQQNGKVKVTIAGVSTERSAPIADGTGISISLSGNEYTVTTNFGVTVKYDHSKHWVKIEVDDASSALSSVKGKLCGICGNWNGKAADDKIPNGSNSAGTDNQIGESWKIANSPCL